MDSPLELLRTSYPFLVQIWVILPMSLKESDQQVEF